MDCVARVSSESDSAALAPLQQGFRVSEDRLVPNLSRIDALDPVQNSLRERSPDVWQVSVTLGPGQATDISTLLIVGTPQRSSEGGSLRWDLWVDDTEGGAP